MKRYIILSFCWVILCIGITSAQRTRKNISDRKNSDFVITNIRFHGFVDVHHPSLGIKVGRLINGYTEKESVGVREIIDKSAAMDAGIHENDIISKINNTLITSISEFTEQESKFHSGDKVFVTFIHNQEEKTTVLTLKDEENHRENPSYIVELDVKNNTPLKLSKCQFEGYLSVTDLPFEPGYYGNYKDTDKEVWPPNTIKSIKIELKCPEPNAPVYRFNYTPKFVHLKILFSGNNIDKNFVYEPMLKVNVLDDWKNYQRTIGLRE